MWGPASVASYEPPLGLCRGSERPYKNHVLDYELQDVCHVTANIDCSEIVDRHIARFWGTGCPKFEGDHSDLGN